MKNYLALLCFVLLLSSCSQQQFAFRKKIAVRQPNKVVVQNQSSKVVDSLVTIEANEQLVYTEPLPFVSQQNKLEATSTAVLPDDTIRKKYKFDEDKKPNNPDSVKDDENVINDLDRRNDSAALVGFVLGLVGLFILLPAAIPGLIFSIRGLKSERRKGLAIAGLIFNILAILLLVFFLLIIIMIFAALGA